MSTIRINEGTRRKLDKFKEYMQIREYTDRTIRVSHLSFTIPAAADRTAGNWYIIRRCRSVPRNRKSKSPANLQVLLRCVELVLQDGCGR